MRITLESTDKIVQVRYPYGREGSMEARVWIGQTDSGVPVHCFITRISPRSLDPEVLAQFEAELLERAAPSPEIEAIPLRLIL